MMVLCPIAVCRGTVLLHYYEDGGIELKCHLCARTVLEVPPKRFRRDREEEPITLSGNSGKLSRKQQRLLVLQAAILRLSQEGADVESIARELRLSEGYVRYVQSIRSYSFGLS